MFLFLLFLAMDVKQRKQMVSFVVLFGHGKCFLSLFSALSLSLSLMYINVFVLIKCCVLFLEIYEQVDLTLHMPLPG